MTTEPVESRARPLAIVTDGMWRKSLSAIRSLGKAGYEVHVFGDTRVTVGFWSRFADRRIVASDAKDSAADFGSSLIEHLVSIRRTRSITSRPILLPMEEETLQYVVEHADRLRQLCDFIVPDPTVLAVCADKAATMALAAQVGIPHPRTAVARSAEELISAIRQMGQEEYVVKPLHGSGSRGVRYNLRPVAASVYTEEFGACIVQDRLPPDGAALGVSILLGKNGEYIAAFSHQRLQQFPTSGGPSTDRIGIESRNLEEMSLRLLRSINWRGVAMVEWKVDQRDGKPKLIEINPRFWGSLELAVRSGVDFPTLYARAAQGSEQQKVTPILGVRCRWLIPGDSLRWLTTTRHEREPLRTFLSGLPASAEEWDRSDLRGFVACIVCQAAALLRPKYRAMLRR